MNDPRTNLVTRVKSFQVAVAALEPGATKAEMSAQLEALIQALADSNACGPLRPGIELLPAS